MPSLISVLGANIGPFVSELGKAKAQAKHHGEGIGQELGHSINHALMQFVSVAALEEIIHQTIKFGAHIQDLSMRLGMSAEAVQQWDYALKLNGSSIDNAVGFFEKLEVARGKALKGNEEMIAHFKNLGVTMEQLKNDRNLGALVGEAFEHGDPQKLIADLRAVGGKGAGEMVATFREGFLEMAEDARKSGVIMSGETTESLHRIEDSFTRFKGQVMAGFAPMIAFVGDVFMHFNDGLRVAINGLTGLMDGFISAGGLSLKAMINPLAMAKAIKAGAVEGFELMKVEAHKVEAEHEAAEHRAAKRKAMAKNPLNLDEEESDAARNKAQRELEEAARIWSAHKEREIKLEDDLRRKKDANALAEMTTKQKILELARREFELQEEAAGLEKGSEAELEARNKIEDLKKETIEAQKQQKREDEAELKKYKVSHGQAESNSLQKFGGLLRGGIGSSPEDRLLDVQKKSERHLDAIRKALTARGVAEAAGGDDAAF